MSSVDPMNLVSPTDLQARQVGMHLSVTGKRRPRLCNGVRVGIWLALTSLQ